MIHIGNLVKISDKFYSFTINFKPEKDIVGIVVDIEKDFYKHSNGCYIDRCKILFNDQISYEPANALVVVE
jgi:hypothetical protein